MLFQLPPYSKQDLGLLESFLDQTSGIPERVFEFRHESWLVDSTFRLLDGKDVAFCVVDTEDFKTENKITGNFAYYRLRRESYEGKGVDEWSANIQKATKGLDKAYVYLRHDETGKNAVLAQGMASKLR